MTEEIQRRLSEIHSKLYELCKYFIEQRDVGLALDVLETMFKVASVKDELRKR